VARLGFLGTPELAVTTLDALVAAGHDVALVITQPDRKRGRGGALVKSPVKLAAEAHHIEVSDEMEALRDASLEACVVVAYGRIIPTSLLTAVPMLNLHFSLLPRWRGAAPVERAILAGDRETGVCVMEVVPALDEGGIYAMRRVAIAEKSLDELRAELCELGSELLVELLASGVAALPAPAPQVGVVTYAKKLEATELELDFSRPAHELARLVRLGRAFTFLGASRLRILEARVGPSVGSAPGELHGTSVATGDGSLVLVKVQPEGKRAMDAGAWRRGLQQSAAVHLGRKGDL
jgi:methionyl-tRNA formyltransferase